MTAVRPNAPSPQAVSTTSDLPPGDALHRTRTYVPFRRRLLPYRSLLVLLVVGAVAYIALAIVQATDLDEGGYLLAAVQIAHGQLPFVNFVGIEPVVPYYLAAGVLLFGPSVLVARLQLILLVLATAAGVYEVGRTQHSEGAGLLAASVFLFSPLALYYNSIVIVEGASLAPLVLATVLLLRPRVRGPMTTSLAVGILLGLAFLTRRDTAILAPLFLVMALLRSPAGRRLRSGLAMAGGVTLPTVPVLGYFTLRTSIAWMYAQYGFGAAYAAASQSLPYHVGVAAYGVLVLPALALGLSGAVAHSLGVFGLPRWARWANRVAGLPAVLVLLYGLSYQSWGQGESFFPDVPVAFGIVLVSWLLLFLGFSGTAWTRRTLERATAPFLLVWIALILGFLTFVYPAFFVHYLIEITAPASILVGVLMADRVAHVLAVGGAAPGGSIPSSPRDRRWRTRARASLSMGRHPTAYIVVLALVLVIPSASAGILILGPTNPYNNPYANGLPAQNLYQRVYPLSEVDQIARFLDSHTSPDETIFTADSVFAASANRLVLLNLSTVIDDYAYAATPLRMDQSPLSYDPYNLAPSLSYIFSVWNRTYVPYVVVGNKTVSLEVENPYVEEYIAGRYHPVAVFDPGLLSQVVVIEALGAVSGSAVLTGSFATNGATSSIAIDPANGAAYLSDYRNSSIEVAIAAGSYYFVPLPSPVSAAADLAISPNGATLVVGRSSAGLVVYTVGGSGALTLEGSVATRGEVSAIAFATNPSLAYALLPTLDEVAEVDLATLEVRATFPVVGDPAALTISSAQQLLAVASGNAPVVATYNLSSGALVRQYPVGSILANHLAFAGSSVVGTQFLPAETFWLNLSTGTMGAVERTGTPAEGFAAGGGLVFVGGGEDGLVTVFNATTGSPTGFLPITTCPGTMAYNAATRALWAAGVCTTGAEEWTVSEPVSYSVLVPNGTAVSLDGLRLAEAPALQLLRGVYLVTAVRDGASATVLASVSGPGTLTVEAPNFAGTEDAVEGAFLLADVSASAVAVVALSWVAARRPTWFGPCPPVDSR